MKQTFIHQTLALMRWVGFWVAIASLLSLSTWHVAAQEPTPIPTPTPADTPTPGSATATPVSPTSEPSTVPTATSPSSSATTRLIAFRVDEKDIEEGDCASFNWVVRGDIGIVEFDIKGDGKEPFLVSEEDERQECPEDNTKYQLIVTWLDGSKSEGDTIEVEVHTGGGNSSSSGGSGGAVAATPGAFLAVTPIPAQDIPNNPLPAPTGVLGSVSVLPETGLRSPSQPATTPLESKIKNEEFLIFHSSFFIKQGQWLLRLLFASGFIIGLSSAILGLVFLARYLGK
jgi:hypothetical protein